VSPYRVEGMISAISPGVTVFTIVDKSSDKPLSWLVGRPH